MSDIPSMAKHEIKLFWSYVDRHGPMPRIKNWHHGRCWLWLKGKTTAGYGLFYLARSGRRYYAHRVAETLRHGPLALGMETCHMCDIPHCVRHTFRGKHIDNMRDAMKKNRTVGRKSKHPLAKLSATQVTEIRNICAGRILRPGHQPKDVESLRAIGRRLKVSHQTISDVVRQKFYKSTSFIMRPEI